ncbi:MAG: AMP-binding protein [Nitrospiraceae bacterium]|nr:AMP-binding protein [Nitrospiraceae bacterium]
MRFEISELPENQRTLTRAFLESAKLFHGKTLFSYESGGQKKTLSYNEFFSMACSLALLLRQRGINPQDRVAIIAPPSLRWCLSFAGIVLAGAVAVPLNESAQPEEITAILKDAQPKGAFLSSETQRVSGLCGGVCAGMLLLDVESELAGPVTDEAGFPGWSDFSAPEKPAVILYTSGTTSMPKGVVLTNNNLVSDALAALDTQIIGEDENVLAPLPFYHAYPLTCSFIAEVFAGATITIPPSIKEMARTAKESGVSIILAVPQMLELMDQSIRGKLPAWARPLVGVCGLIRRNTGFNAGRLVFAKAHRALGGKVRILASGGARLEPSVMLSLEALGFTVVEGYGLTETSPVVTFNPLEKRKPGSAGIALSTARLKIEDGEVLLSGPMLMNGYWNRPEETARVIRDGWFHTGDLGYVDNEGYLFITGRKKEVIVLSSGKNVFPDEVERHYGQAGLVKEIAVYDEKGALKAFVVPDMEAAKMQGAGSLKEAIGWELMRLSAKIPAYMRIRGFSLVEGPLPRTSLGKLKRHLLAKMKSGEMRKKQGAGAVTDPVLTKSSAGRTLVGAIHSVMREKVAIRADDNLEMDLGLDSLGRVELLNALENALALSVPDDFLSDVQTVGELLDKTEKFIEGHTGARNPLKKEEKLARGGILFKTVTVLVKAVTKTLFRVDATGVENFPEPPFIIAPNHTSFLDGFLILGVLPSRLLDSLYFQGIKKYFRPFPPRLVAGVHVIPIDAGALLSGALKASAGVFKAKGALCVFPEGGRSIEGELMELKRGVPELAKKEGVPVVPAWIEGAIKALPRGAVFPRPVKITVRFGRPLLPDDFNTAEEMRAALRSAILDLR